MRPIIIVSDRFLEKISLLMPIAAISLFPFIILKKKHESNKRLINHESIHFQQALELGVLPFYLIYVIEYLIKIIIYKDIDKAYFNISFEKEAYNNDDNLNYLTNRKRYNWIKLI